MDSRLRIRRLGEGAWQIPDTMRVSASKNSLARTSFEEIAWLSRVNAGSDAQIFLALRKERHTRQPSAAPLQEFKTQLGLLQIRCVFEHPRAMSILAIGQATSACHNEEAQFRFEKPLRCNFVQSRHLHFRSAQTG